jgi:hypothetical protein
MWPGRPGTSACRPEGCTGCSAAPPAKQLGKRRKNLRFRQPPKGAWGKKKAKGQAAQQRAEAQQAAQQQAEEREGEGEGSGSEGSGSEC